MTLAVSDTPIEAPLAANPNNSLLIVDDDAVFRNRLAQAMTQKGYAVVTAADATSAAALYTESAPAYAVLDMRLGNGENGLSIVPALRARRPDCRIIMLTGYGNIATAVLAIKNGAVDYLAKPADADDIDAALKGAGAALPPLAEKPMPAERVKWEHISRVFEQTGRNVSEAARQLNMHRRTLQRILGKYAPAEHKPRAPANNTH